ncbi:reverse transcriptase domain-containing protein [Tanacetum coccineum]
MTLELADRSITYPKGLTEDVFVKVRKFHFPTDFVVVDFKADPPVPLILERSFLRTGRALIDVYGEEITLRVDNEAVTFNLDQTMRYSSTNDKSVNRIDIIDAVYEEYAPELLGFSNSSGGNPTPTSKPFTSKFILEEIEAYLKDDLISPENDHADCDPEEDICLIEKLLNNDPFQLPPMDLKQKENDKLLVIIAKGLKDDEKEALLKVLKSHKRAIAWKITDIKELDVPKSLPKPNIPYPSRRDDQKSHDKASNQMEKIFQIFQDLRFYISFADALLLMPRFAPTIKSLLMNKDKLLELAKIPLIENCSVMLLKKLPEKLGDPVKYLIPEIPGNRIYVTPCADLAQA